MNSRRARRTLDRLAYASLVLDICIAIITSLSILGVNAGHFLIPVNYLLTIVVVLSVVMFVVLLLLRAKERQSVPGSRQESGRPGPIQLG